MPRFITEKYTIHAQEDDATFKSNTVRKSYIIHEISEQAHIHIARTHARTHTHAGNFIFPSTLYENVSTYPAIY